MKNHITFGVEFDYLFKHIDIDERYGVKIMADGEVIGGLLTDSQTIMPAIQFDCPVFTQTLIKGIEIVPEWRRKGIAREIVKKIMESCDIAVGVITDENSLPFWGSTGATIINTTEYLKKEDPIIFTMRGVKERVYSFYIVKEGVDEKAKKHFDKCFDATR